MEILHCAGTSGTPDIQKPEFLRTLRDIVVVPQCHQQTLLLERQGNKRRERGTLVSVELLEIPLEP